MRFLHMKMAGGLASAVLLGIYVSGAAALSVPHEVLYPGINGAEPVIYGSTVFYQHSSTSSNVLYLIEVSTKQRRVLRNNQLVAVYPLDYGGTHAAWIRFATFGGGGDGGTIPSRKTANPNFIPVNPLDIDCFVEIIDTATKTVTTISTTTDYKEFLAMDKGGVVWTDYCHSTAADTFPEVYLYTISDSAVNRITNTLSYKADVDIDGNRIVWQDYRNAGSSPENADIYLYDPNEGERAVCVNNAYQAQPCISGNIVVWQDYRNAGTDGMNADIYMKDLSTNTEKNICDNPAYQAHPLVSGDYVVWHDYRHAGTSDPENTAIYLYEISTGTEIPVVTKAGFQGQPRIYGSKIVWYDYTDNSIYIGTIQAGDAGINVSIERFAANLNAMSAIYYDLAGKRVHGITHENAMKNRILIGIDEKGVSLVRKHMR